MSRSSVGFVEVAEHEMSGDPCSCVGIISWDKRGKLVAFPAANKRTIPLKIASD